MMLHLKRKKTATNTSTNNDNNDDAFQKLDKNLEYLLNNSPVVTGRMALTTSEPFTSQPAKTPREIAELGLSLASPPITSTNPVDLFASYKAYKPEDNIVVAVRTLSQHYFVYFTLYQASIIAEMQKNPAHAMIWVQSFNNVHNFQHEKSGMIPFEELMQRRFFKDQLVVFGKYYDLIKQADPLAPVQMDNDLRVKIVQLLLLNKNAAAAIWALDNKANVTDFTNIVDYHHSNAFPQPEREAKAAKKPKTK